MDFQFSVIRFVPDPARGEFVNIGAIAGSDQARDWKLRLVSSLSRAKAIDDRAALPAAMACAAELEDHIAALEQLPGTGGPEAVSVCMLRARAAEMQNIVQLSAPAPVAADSAEDALDLIFDQLVLDAERRSYDFERKNRAQAAVRNAYRSHAVPANAVRERTSVQCGPFEGIFDFAVHNGRAVQLVQCWSFQLPNQSDLAEQVKAWSWLVHEIRNKGGKLAADGDGVEVPRDLDIYAIAVEPKPGQPSPAYNEAKAAFRENGVEEVGLGGAEVIGERAIAALQPRR
ncbi:MAG TPA: DUF3037 domain-containing protein [Solirubrobacteraceae bacterium]|nr:DUF3037 domain-containing protein [Solirubrobacteraceae bacterium]